MKAGSAPEREKINVARLDELVELYTDPHGPGLSDVQREELSRMHECVRQSIRLALLGSRAWTRPRAWRAGQAFFNKLHPALQDLLQGTEHDPFFDDSKLGGAVEFLYRRLSL